MIVVGMVSARTVNLSHLAAEQPGDTLVGSTYRRLQRFFQHVRLEQDWAAPIVENLCGLKQSNKWYLVSSVGSFVGAVHGLSIADRWRNLLQFQVGGFILCYQRSRSRPRVQAHFMARMVHTRS